MRRACTLILALALGPAVHVAAQSVTRHIPHHPATILTGCTDTQRTMILTHISAAIDVGAPAYNDGDYLGCYRAYEAAARSIERALPNQCAGPSRALREGRANAAAATDDSARAWAMRDAFDGLLYVLVGSY